MRFGALNIVLNAVFFTEEEQVDKEGKDDHADGPEKEHHDKVGGAAAERVFLQHSTISENS